MSTNSNDLLQSITQGVVEQVIIDTFLAPTSRLLLLLQSQSGEKGSNQTNQQKRKGTIFYITQILKQEGFLGFWKGNLVEVVKNSVNTAFTSLFAKLYEPLFLNGDPNQDKLSLSFKEFVLFCAVECSALVLTYPLRVIRAKFSTLSKNPDQKGFKGLIQCIKRIWNEEGFRGFYKGFTVSLAQAINNALFLTLDRVFMREYSTETPGREHHKRKLAQEILYSGTPARMALTFLKRSRTVKSVRRSTNKMIMRAVYNIATSLILYPYGVLQTRMIMNEKTEMKEASPREFLLEVLEKEGFRGLYSGASMAGIKSMGMITIYPIARAFAKKFSRGVFGEAKKEETEGVAEKVEKKKKKCKSI